MAPLAGANLPFTHKSATEHPIAHNPRIGPGVSYSPATSADGREAGRVYGRGNHRAWRRGTPLPQGWRAISCAFFATAPRTWSSRSLNGRSGGNSGCSLPSSVISMIRHAMTRLMAMARRNRPAVWWPSSSMRHPDFNTRCQSSIRQRRHFPAVSRPLDPAEGLLLLDGNGAAGPRPRLRARFGRAGLGAQHPQWQAVGGERQRGVQMRSPALRAGLVRADAPEPFASRQSRVVQVAAILTTPPFASAPTVASSPP